MLFGCSGLGLICCALWCLYSAVCVVGAAMTSTSRTGAASSVDKGDDPTIKKMLQLVSSSTALLIGSIDTMANDFYSLDVVNWCDFNNLMAIGTQTQKVSYLVKCIGPGKIEPFQGLVTVLRKHGVAPPLANELQQLIDSYLQQHEGETSSIMRISDELLSPTQPFCVQRRSPSRSPTVVGENDTRTRFCALCTVTFPFTSGSSLHGNVCTCMSAEFTFSGQVQPQRYFHPA